MSFRFGYRFAGKQKTLTFGTYPDVSLSSARQRLQEARTLLAAGVDPAAQKQAAKAAAVAAAVNTFAAVAAEWMHRTGPTRKAVTNANAQRWLDVDILPKIGRMVAAEIRPTEVLAVVRAVEAAGVAKAHRQLALIGRILRFAVATGRAERDVTSDLRGAVPSAQGGHFKAITEPGRLVELLTALDTYVERGGTPVVAAAVRVGRHVFVRPGELRAVRWDEIDMASSTWSISAERMKMGIAHVVPLSRQVQAMLAAIPRESPFVFPHRRNNKRPMTGGAISVAL
jgi:integrase